MLSEPFTREELMELFAPTETCGSKADYDALTDPEKAIVAELGSVPPQKSDGAMHRGVFADLFPSVGASFPDRRRRMKASLVKCPFFGMEDTGCVYVWSDGTCADTSSGFYYVRGRLNMFAAFGSTAYQCPALIVKKSKLRPDQVKYMEHKCRETRAAVERDAEEKVKNGAGIGR